MAEAEISLDDEKEEKSTSNKSLPDLTSGDSTSAGNSKEELRVAVECSGAKGHAQSPGGERCKMRTITFGRRCKSKGKEGSSKKRKGAWNFKLNCCRLRKNLELDIPEPNVGCTSCVCTGYRRTEEHHLGAGIVFEAASSVDRCSFFNGHGKDYGCFAPEALSKPNAKASHEPSNASTDLFHIEDWDEKAREQRAREIEEGIDPPPGYQPSQLVPYVGEDLQLVRLAASFKASLAFNIIAAPLQMPHSSFPSFVERQALALFEEPYVPTTVHTQVDYIHCLVPDLMEITNCSFYWGKMDRYEAEKLLDNKSEGTFLLRDSAQEDYLFSVSFRRYGRSLHARIEQWNHKFSFDSHDPGVFASDTVCGLIEHYKDPTCCMFFEPMLTIPMHRTWTFPLQHLCRAVICRLTTYDGVNQLLLPKTVKSYLKEYHYKQRVRVRRFEAEQ